MAKEAEQKTIQVEGLGEVTQVKDGVFKMSNSEVNEFFKKEGIPDYKELMDNITNVKNKFIETAVDGLLKGEVIKTKKEQILKAGTGNGHFDTTLEPQVTRRNIRTGESYTVYGNVKVKTYDKSPFKPGDKNGLFEKLSAEIEKNCK